MVDASVPTSESPSRQATVALVGAPNAGKSTLFNRLLGRRLAITDDTPGVTRDRHDAIVNEDNVAVRWVDTGGWLPRYARMSDDPFQAPLNQQVEHAMAEATVIAIVADGRSEGPNEASLALIRWLRQQGWTDRCCLLLNKTDGLNDEALQVVKADWACTGLPTVFPISGMHGHGLDAFRQHVTDQATDRVPDDAAAPSTDDDRLRLAIIGRPNVGKSTWVNQLCGYDRVIAADAPGTTRDAIDVDIVYDGQAYCLVDTAGVRRKGRVDGRIERYAVLRSMDAMAAADVTLYLIDGSETITDQDCKLMGYVVEQLGRPLIVGVNKWDLLDEDGRQSVLQDIDRKLRFLPHDAVLPVSARRGKGVRTVMKAVQAAHQASSLSPSTSQLTEWLTQALIDHPPPLTSNGRRIKLRYAHLGGTHPPTIIVHGKQTQRLPNAYRRYLQQHFRTYFRIGACPVKFFFKTDSNPYDAAPKRGSH